MGTKQTTTTTNQYNPAGMQTYNALQGPAAGVFNSNINNPYDNAFFNSQKAAGSSAATGFSRPNTQANAALGINNPTFNASQTTTQGRATLANQGRMTNNLILGAASNRETSLQSAMNYRPLQTGGTEVKQTSGLGTWLPQVIGMGIGAVTGGLGLGGQQGGFGAAAMGAGKASPFGGFLPRGGGQQGGGQQGGSGSYWSTAPLTYNNSLTNNSSGFDSNGNPLAY